MALKTLLVLELRESSAGCFGSRYEADGEAWRRFGHTRSRCGYWIRVCGDKFPFSQQAARTSSANARRGL
jgi:hypothetical protein